LQHQKDNNMHFNEFNPSQIPYDEGLPTSPVMDYETMREKIHTTDMVEDDHEPQSELEQEKHDAYDRVKDDGCIFYDENNENNEGGIQC
jgi:hypothetical protein